MSENERAVTQPATAPVRVAFTKTGALSFISHLDLMRTVTRMLIRADIGIYYTEGFNPHPKLVFALPLSVGVESTYELFDVKVMGESADYALIAESLRRESPDDIKIIDAYAPERKFRDIAYSDYDIVIRGTGCCDDPVGAVEKMMAGPIVEMKRTKSGETECDIRPFIKSLVCEGGRDELRIKTRLDAASESYLNPEYVVKAVTNATGITLDNIAPGGDVYEITRTGIFDIDGNVFR